MVKIEAKTILLVILAGALLLTLDYLGLDRNIKNAFFSLTSPLQRLLWEKGQNLNLWLETISEMRDLKQINDELESKNQALEAQLARLEGLRTENQDLRTALGLGLEKDFQLLLAETITKDALEDTIVINQGSRAGIKVGSPVLTPEKALVGRVDEVWPDFARVMLITNTASSFDAKVEGSDILGVVKGKGSLRSAFDLIPQDKKLQGGQRLVTTSLAGVFPKDILIGEITEVSSSDIKPFQVAQIKPAFQIKNLNLLLIITDFVK